MRPGEHPLAELGRGPSRAPSPSRGATATTRVAAALALARIRRAPCPCRRSIRGVFTACRDEASASAFAEALVERAPATPTSAWSSCSRSGPTSTAAAPITRPGRADQRQPGARRADDAARSCAGRSSSRPAGRAFGSSRGWSRRWSTTSPTSPAAFPCSPPRCSSSGSERSGRTLRRASYGRAAASSGAVARLAERAYRRLSEPQRERARAILLRLADAEEAEAPVRRRVAARRARGRARRGRRRALAVLTESRLVTVDEGTVEVAHEALLREWPRLRGWLEEDAEGRRLHQHLIDAAARMAGRRARSGRALPRRPPCLGARLGRRATIRS